MKKLLSAVTSAVMSTSLMTGAFASSVSAAGSYAAAQPNVSMGGVLDVAANKTAGEDVVFDFGKWTANAGETIDVDVLLTLRVKPFLLWMSDSRSIHLLRSLRWKKRHLHSTQQQ